VRVDVNPTQLNNYGLTMSNVQSVLSTQNADLAKGQISDGTTTADIIANDQISQPEDYKPIIIGYHNGAAVRLSDVAQVTDGTEHPLRRIPQWHSFGHGDHFSPAGRQYHPDRRQYSQPVAISQGVDSAGHRHHHCSRPHHHDPRLRNDVERTLVLSVILVILVVFLFLRNGAPL
jgi:multidrug efflux pump